MKTIRVAITFNVDEDPEAFSDVTADHIRDALCRAYPYAMGHEISVTELPSSAPDTLPADPPACEQCGGFGCFHCPTPEQ